MCVWVGAICTYHNNMVLNAEIFGCGDVADEPGQGRRARGALYYILFYYRATVYTTVDTERRVFF